MYFFPTYLMVQGKKGFNGKLDGTQRNKKGPKCLNSINGMKTESLTCAEARPCKHTARYSPCNENRKVCLRHTLLFSNDIVRKPISPKRKTIISQIFFCFLFPITSHLGSSPLPSLIQWNTHLLCACRPPRLP